MSKEYVKNVTVHSTEYPYEMSGWCHEKTREALRHIAYILDMIKNKEDLNQIEEEFYPVINYLTKLLSLYSLSKWDHEHVDIVFDKGFAGFEELAVKYGIISRTSAEEQKLKEQEKIEKFRSVLKEIERLLYDWRNRPIIYDLIRENRNLNNYMEKLYDLIEDVTLGNIKWEVFVKDAKEIINNA